MDEITTEIEIDASPAVVWEVLTDFESYSEWNPSLEIDGDTNEGGRLEVTLTYPNQRPTTVHPKVLVVDEPTEFRWQGRLFVPGLYDGEHRFVLTPLNDGTRAKVVQAEIFRGVLVGFINRRIRSNVKEGFKQMNEALKHRVENTDVDASREDVQETETD